MASDSDLEAYLNQLSKKTHKLQQDVRTHGYSSSRLPSEEDKSELSELSGEILSEKQTGHSKISQGVSLADITALSDKYAISKKSNKTQLYDEFKNLEQKYSKKASQKSTIRSESPVLSDGENYHKSAKTVKASKPDVSDDSLVDDELARYLNENSLEDNPKALESQDGSVAESDEVFNLDNIMTVDDILGQLTEEDDDNDDGNSENKDEVAIVNDSLDQNNENSIGEENKSKGKRKMSIFEGINGSPFYSSNNMNTHESLLAKHTAGDKDDTEGLLFHQVTDNIFHSSRRNSLMSPVFKRKSSSKSLLSESVQDIPNTSEEDTEEGSVAESVEENISVSHESSTAKSVAEGSFSEKENTHYSEKLCSNNSAASEIEGTKSKITVKVTDKSKSDKEVKTKLEEEKSVKHRLSEHKATESKRKLSSDHSVPGTSNQANGSKMRDHVEQVDKASDEDDESKSDKKSRKKNKKSGSNTHRKSGRKHKKKLRRRSSSSSSTSSTSSSSSSSDSRYYEEYKDSHGRKSQRAKWKKGPSYNPWLSNPYISPWWWMHFQQHSFSASAETPLYVPNFRLVEGLLPSSSVVGVQDIMRQQVALTRQFMESQKSLYHAYTATLTSCYRYTSLRDTENYIKHRKHPLTFDEAYKLVKEEIKNDKK